MSGRRGVVTVIGSLNMDLVVRVPHLPRAAETVLGTDLMRFPGGKGANQAVAARRAGAEVRMVGAVGDDPDGAALVTALRAAGVDVSAVSTSPRSTGTALICVDPQGENQIVVAAGANDDVSVPPNAFDDAAVALASLEVPMAAVIEATATARTHGAIIVVNPAPATDLPGPLLDLGPILVPNEGELARISGDGSIEGGVRWLQASGVTRIVVTRGPLGCLVVDGEARREIPSSRVGDVVDTTGAGDTFCGILAAWLAHGSSLAEAAEAANAGAGLSVAQRGAQAGMPSRAGIIKALGGP